MKPAELAHVLAQVADRWPRHPLPVESGDVWLADLAEFDRALVEAAVRSLGAREFPPTSGHVAAEARRLQQGPAPGFDDMLAAVWAALPTRVWVRRFYTPDGQTTRSATAEAIAVMQTNGAHEAVCRFVQSRGLRSVHLIPDGAMHPLDLNQQADRRDAARSYRDSVLPDWERDPSPGIALRRACRSAGLEVADALELAAAIVDRHHLATTARPALPAPTGADPDEPMVNIDPEQLLADYRARRARAATARIHAGHDQLQAEREHRAAAERELAEHAARRSVVA